MIDLRDIAGLPIRLVGKGLEFYEGLKAVVPDVRRLSQARYAFSDGAAEGMEELYYMYRDVAWCADRERMAELGLRFDITVIPPGRIGREYNKTVGHYHPLKPGMTVTYPEVYEVLHGEAVYVMQRRVEGDEEGRAQCSVLSAQWRVSSDERPVTNDALLNEHYEEHGTRNKERPSPVSDVYAVKAKRGDKVVIPPGYGHVTINAGSEVLVMANWVASGFQSIYGEYRELGGGAYYLFGRDGEQQWQANPLYGNPPPLRHEATCDYPQFGFYKGVPMYTLIQASPERLVFLA